MRRAAKRDSYLFQNDGKSSLISTTFENKKLTRCLCWVGKKVFSALPLLLRRGGFNATIHDKCVPQVDFFVFSPKGCWDLS